jgi:hypothetical protein
MAHVRMRRRSAAWRGAELHRVGAGEGRDISGGGGRQAQETTREEGAPSARAVPCRSAVSQLGAARAPRCARRGSRTSVGRRRQETQDIFCERLIWKQLETSLL